MSNMATMFIVVAVVLIHSKDVSVGGLRKLQIETLEQFIEYVNEKGIVKIE